MANNYIGSGILFGTGSTTGTLTGLGSLTLLQSSEFSTEADQELVRDADGNTRTVIKYDHRAKAVLEFIPTGGTNTGTLAVTSLPSIGTTLSLVDSLHAPMAGTWLVEDVSTPRSNTGAMKARISLSRYLQNSLP